MKESANVLLKATTTPSRRRFLHLATLAGAVGLTGCAAPTPQVVEKQVEVTRPVEVTRQVEVTKEVAKPIPQVPWQYVALDVEQTRKLGHASFYKGDCAYGAFAAILNQLVEKVGHPFNQMPAEMFMYGAGGVAGWGTLCGALLGASSLIGLVVKKDDANKLISELLGWYSETALPTETSNQYAVSHQMLVQEYKSDKMLVQSVSKSPLCHASVSGWCTASGLASGSKERAERCARLAGDVAAHAVKFLNAYHSNQFVASYKPSSEAQLCSTCHTKGEDFKVGNFTQGKGECLECHDPHALNK